MYSFLSVSVSCQVCVCLTAYDKRWCMLSSASGFYVGMLQKLTYRNASTKDKT